MHRFDMAIQFVGTTCLKGGNGAQNAQGSTAMYVGFVEGF